MEMSVIDIITTITNNVTNGANIPSTPPSKSDPHFPSSIVRKG